MASIPSETVHKMHLRSSLLSLASLCSILLASACSDGGQGTADMSPDLAPGAADFGLAPREPTDHPAALQMQNLGGPTIAAIEPYTIVWKGQEELGQKAHAFLSWMVTSSYWTSVVGEYGGGLGTPKSLIVLPDDPPATIDYAKLNAIISTLVANGTIPAVTANTALFFVPSTSTVSMNGRQTGCQDFGGYHQETAQLFDGHPIPYAVNLQCNGDALAFQSGFDRLTHTLSHEAAEIQTNPYYHSRPAWVAVDPAPALEVADLCHLSDTVVNVPGPTPTDYTVTTVYSQQAALAGNREPCQPTPANQPYFNVAINPIAVHVVTDASGAGQTTAEYQPFAYGDVGTIRWTLEQPVGAGIKLTPFSGEAKAGDTIGFTIEASAAARAGTYPLVLKVRSDVGATYYTATVVVE